MMDFLQKNAETSKQLNEMLLLRFEPIAVKFTTDDKDISETAIRPMRDLGKHMALCQAFALTRRDKKTVYMEKGDHWCWNPMVGFGFIDNPDGEESISVISRYFKQSSHEAASNFFNQFPRLPQGTYTGILSVPLCDCPLEPDLVLVYLNGAQLRSAVFAAKSVIGGLVKTELDAIDSCVYATIPTLKTGEFRVTIPDFGEYERAMAEEHEMIFTIPTDKMDALVAAMRSTYDGRKGYPHYQREMLYDFPRPAFYNELFDVWGLDTGEQWTR